MPTARVVVLLLVSHASNADGSYVSAEHGIWLPGTSKTLTGVQADALVAAYPGVFTVSLDTADPTDTQIAQAAAELAETNAETAETNAEHAQADAEAAQSAAETARNQAGQAKNDAQAAQSAAEAARNQAGQAKNDAQAAAASLADAFVKAVITVADSNTDNAAVTVDLYRLDGVTRISSVRDFSIREAATRAALPAGITLASASVGSVLDATGVARSDANGQFVGVMANTGNGTFYFYVDRTEMADLGKGLIVEACAGDQAIWS